MNAAASTQPALCIAVLLSGSGRTLQNIADAIRKGELNATITSVIASRPDVYGLTRAVNLNLPSLTITRKSFESTGAFSQAIFAAVDASGANLVCLAGFLSMLEIPSRWAGRVVNIHPSLLPSFGGHGMYGDRVHAAVLEAGCKVTGCTVHFADEQYDTGPIIVQRTCPVLEDDDVHTLADRVFEQESIAYLQALQLLAADRVRIEGRRTRIIFG